MTALSGSRTTMAMLGWLQGPQGPVSGSLRVLPLVTAPPGRLINFDTPAASVPLADYRRRPHTAPGCPLSPKSPQSGT